MFKYNIKKYIFLIAACTLSNCQQYHPMEMLTCLTKLSSFIPSDKGYKESSPVAYAKLEVLLPKFIVAVLPSPGENAAQTDQIKNALKKSFGEDISVIQIKSIEGLKPIDIEEELKIEQYTKEIFNEILCTLADRFHIKSSLKFQKYNLPIHILGYEQPKLVASIKAQNYNLLSSSLCNIKTLSVADPVEDKKLIKNDMTIHFFKYDENKNIPGYIDFLKQEG
ncbi:hypothetical protein [Cardinium endosymbiont of Nabis limbatus]|uniref:hypothetical protein n=1 Tax=Cardinium endosymbiont of Nabis limbatus TaxID=3066217 RepID=UPI003AF40781